MSTLCIGEQVIRNLAEFGEYHNGDTYLIAADSLFKHDPYIALATMTAARDALAAELATIKAELPDLICVQLAYPRTCESEPGTENGICAGCVLRKGPTQELNCVRTRRELYTWCARLRGEE